MKWQGSNNGSTWTDIKPYHEMSDDELRTELARWESYVDGASGWSSAYFAAKQLETIVRIGNERGLGFVNRFSIRHK
jgi:hypothetical protein